MDIIVVVFVVWFALCVTGVVVFSLIVTWDRHRDD